MKEKNSKTMMSSASSKKSYSPKGTEEEKDPNEDNALIYKGKGRRFGFKKKRPFKASLRATLMSLRSNWATTEETTHGTSSAFPGGYLMPWVEEDAHLDKDWTSATVIRIRKNFLAEPERLDHHSTPFLCFGDSARMIASARQPSSAQ